MGFIITAISAIVVFALLIFFHELGHFSVAKWVGIKVHEFAIGMGPLLFKFRRGETMYSLRALPIGGYVKMEGEDANSEDERAFNKKPLWARIAVVIAGAFMNLVLGYILFVILYGMAGGMMQPVIGKFSADSPAEQAGMQLGDRIVKMNNFRIYTFSDLKYFLSQNKTEPVEMKMERNGQPLIIKITPVEVKQKGINPQTNKEEEFSDYIIGFQPSFIADKSLNGIMKNAYSHTVSMSRIIILSLRDLVTGKFKVEQMSGPVGIVGAIGTAAKHGLAEVMSFAALISINLGIFNILPIPALDGGRLVFLAVEVIRKKPINPEKEGYVHMIGFAMLMLLLLFTSFNDVKRLFGF